MFPLISIGCPVRNRDWILPLYLKRLEDLDYPKSRIIPTFIINDSTDRSEEILYEWAVKHADEYAWISISKIDMGQIEDQRTRQVRDKIYTTLSQIRNQLIEKVLELNCDYLFSVDSDILMSRDSLGRLLKDNKGIIAGQIWNDPGKTYPNIMVETAGAIRHYMRFPRDSVFTCAVSGAIYLIRRDVLEAGVRYGYHAQGEDVYFCQEARRLGHEVWVDSSVHADHIMNKGQLSEIKKPGQ